MGLKRIKGEIPGAEAVRAACYFVAYPREIGGISTSNEWVYIANNLEKWKSTGEASHLMKSAFFESRGTSGCSTKMLRGMRLPFPYGGRRSPCL